MHPLATLSRTGGESGANGTRSGIQRKKAPRNGTASPRHHLRAAQQLAGNIADLRRFLADEGQRAADGERGEAEAGGHQAVEDAFPELRRDPCGNAEAEDLLHQAVADRDAPRHREMIEGRAGEAQEAEEAGPAAVDARERA